VLLPVEAAMGWAVVVLVVAALLTYSRRYWPVWCGLGVAACGAIYYPFVMANANYYALLEFLASSLAVGAGLVSAVVGVFWLLSLEPSRPATNKTAEGKKGDIHYSQKQP